MFVRRNNATGVYAENQTVTSSSAINAGGGELKVGAKSAELSGTGTVALLGTRSGQKFGTHG